MSIGTLLTVLGLLHGRTTSMRASDIFFLLGFSFHLTIVFLPFASTTEGDSVDENIVKIIHTNSVSKKFSDGKVLCL